MDFLWSGHGLWLHTPVNWKWIYTISFFNLHLAHFFLFLRCQYFFPWTDWWGRVVMIWNKVVGGYKGTLGYIHWLNFNNFIILNPKNVQGFWGEKCNTMKDALGGEGGEVTKDKTPYTLELLSKIWHWLKLKNINNQFLMRRPLNNCLPLKLSWHSCSLLFYRQSVS